MTRMIDTSEATAIIADYFDAICDTEYTFDEAVLLKLLNDKAVDAVPVVRCRDCVYYDNPHVEKDGERFEYKDMPNEAFDDLGTGLVNSNYGINVGGRCCRDYNTGYADDKRIFVPETNYCGRAVRKEE